MIPEKEITAETLTDEEVNIVFALRNKRTKDLLLMEKSTSYPLPKKSSQLITSEGT